MNKGIFKRVLLAALCGTLVFSLAACGSGGGVPQSEYDAVVAERDTLKTQADDLLKEKDELQAQYDIMSAELTALKTETADWLTLSETEKATAQAQAESDKIAAEAAAKKAAEEKAAADKKAAEEAEKKRADEEAARLAEEKKGYDTGITYDQIARTPDNYKEKKVKFTGRVVQVIENSDEITLRIATKKSYGSYYDDIILVYYSPSLITSRILEDDIITIYGVSKGLYTYESTLGGAITVPLIKIDKLEQ